MDAGYHQVFDDEVCLETPAGEEAPALGQPYFLAFAFSAHEPEK